MSVKAGQEIIIESGVATFSARKIASKIGYTVGTVYNVFDNHYDIIMSVNLVTLDDLYKLLLDNIGDAKGSEKVKIISNIYIDFAYKDYNRWVLLLEYEIPSDILRPEWYSDKVRKVFALLDEAIIEFGIPEEEVGNYAKIFWSIIHGLCTLSLTRKIEICDIESIKKLATESVEKILIQKTLES